MMLLGSGTVLLEWPRIVNDSEGIEPYMFEEAYEGPEFSSQ